MQAARAALQRLIIAGYTEENLCRFWRVPVASDVRYVPAPHPDERPRRGLGAWFALLVAGETLPTAAFAAPDITALVEDGLVERLDVGSQTHDLMAKVRALRDEVTDFMANLPDAPGSRSPEATSSADRSPAEPVELATPCVRARVTLLPIADVLVMSDRFDDARENAVGSPDLSALNVVGCLPARLDRRRVLDVGCGAGLLSLCAARRGAQVTGGDVHHAALDYAGRNAAFAGLSIDFVVANLFGPLVDQVFDLILFNAPLLRAPLAQSADTPARYTTSPDGELLALLFLGDYRDHLAPDGEVLLHAQLTPAVEATVATIARDCSAVQVVFARAPDGTPHALTSIRAGEPGVRRFEVPLSRFCPHLSRPILDALHADGGDDPIWYPAPWLELRDTRRLGTPAERALSFGAHAIDGEELALLERLQAGNVPTSSLDPSDLGRLFRLAALGVLVRR